MSGMGGGDVDFVGADKERKRHILNDKHGEKSLLINMNRRERTWEQKLCVGLDGLLEEKFTLEQVLFKSTRLYQAGRGGQVV